MTGDSLEYTEQLIRFLRKTKTISNFSKNFKMSPLVKKSDQKSEKIIATLTETC